MASQALYDKLRDVARERGRTITYWEIAPIADGLSKPLDILRRRYHSRSLNIDTSRANRAIT